MNSRKNQRKTFKDIDLFRLSSHLIINNSLHSFIIVRLDIFIDFIKSSEICSVRKVSREQNYNSLITGGQIIITSIESRRN